MHIQNQNIRFFTVALISIGFGCGPSASLPTPRLTQSPAEAISTVPSEGGTVAQSSNLSEQASVASDTVAAIAKDSTPSVPMD